MQRTLDLKLFPKQWEAYKAPQQFVAAVAGVQSGKTFLGSSWAYKKITEHQRGVGVIAAPTHKILQSATLRRFFELFPELRQFYHEQKGEIRIPKGCTVFVRSADDPLGMEGITANWIWLDEGGMCSQLTWTVLRSRVSMTGGQVLITTTPYNMGWLYRQFFLPWKEHADPNLSFHTWRSIDNPRANKEFIKAEESRLDPVEFARRYKGEFRKMTGLIWDLPEEAVVLPVDPRSNAEARVMGIDWGLRHPAAVVVCELKNNVWTAVAEWKRAEQTNAQIIQTARSMAADWRVTRVYPDPAEPDRIKEAESAGLPIYEAARDLFGGISFVQTLIKEGRFKVSREATQLLDEMSMWQWKETKPGKDAKDKPENVDEDLCAALRYCLYSHQPLKQEWVASEPLKKYYGTGEFPF